MAESRSGDVERCRGGRPKGGVFFFGKFSVTGRKRNAWFECVDEFCSEFKCRFWLICVDEDIELAHAEVMTIHEYSTFSDQRGFEFNQGVILVGSGGGELNHKLKFELHALSELVEHPLHLARGMGIAGASGGHKPGLQTGAGIVSTPCFEELLCGHLVRRNIVWCALNDGVKFGEGFTLAAFGGVSHGKAVGGGGVRGGLGGGFGE